MGIETENLEEPEARNKVMESKPTQRPTQRCTPVGCGGMTFLPPYGWQKLNQKAVGCGGLRWVAVG